MAKTSPKQKQVVERVMHAFKTGELEQRDGEPVENPKQAIAIALNEAGATNRKSPADNKAALRKTRAHDAAADKPRSGKSRDALYAEAQRRDIPGRSKMTKAQLEHALRG